MSLSPAQMNYMTDTELSDYVEGQEARRAKTAKQSLTEFVKYINVPGAPVSEDEDEDKFYPEKLSPAAHHKLIIRVLEAVERGAVKRVMIFMPPGSAKSTYATVCFPAWWLGNNPNGSIISVSYGSDLAKKFGRRCRQIVRSKEYYEIFSTALRGDNAAVDEWTLDSGAEYMATGIMAGVMGNRGDGLVIDDPIRGREDADSKVIRDKSWEAYKSDLRTRVKPGGFIIMILTRWHEDDPAGRILPEDYNGESGWITARDGEKWYVLSLQAECERDDDPLGRERGEFLWPEWFTEGFLAQEKITQGPRNWAALYQQRPAPEEGDYFQREWIRWYDWDADKPHNGAPAHLKTYGASDYAVTKDGGDWTVHGVGGVDPNDDLYILDWWRKQEVSDVWIDAFIDLMEKWETIAWGEEAGQILKSLDPFILKRMKERGVFGFRKQYPSKKDKKQRAQSIRGRLHMGKVYLPRNAPWTEVLVSEMMRFTGATGDTDDQVDVLSLFGQMLTGMRKGIVPKKPKGPIDTSVPTFDQLTKWSDEEDDRRKPRI